MIDKDAQIVWYKSALVSLLVLAEAEKSPLTNQHVVSICKHVLAKYDDLPARAAGAADRG